MIDTANMADDEFISHFPAEACTEVGWDDDERSSMEMLAFAIVWSAGAIAAMSAAAVLL